MDRQSSMNKQNREGEIDLLELASFLFTKIVVLIIVFVIGGAAAFLGTWKFITPQYTATAKMYMVSASSSSVIDLTDLNIGTSLSQDYVELIKTRPVYEAVIDDLDLDYTYDELADMISVSSADETRIINISVTSPDPSEARDIANALADEAKDTLPDLMDTSEPSIAEKAITPESKSSPSYTKNTMIGALALLIIAIIVYTVMFLMDDTLKTAEEVEEEFGIMPLTSIPEGNIPQLARNEVKQKRSFGRRLKRWLRRKR